MMRRGRGRSQMDMDVANSYIDLVEYRNTPLFFFGLRELHQ